MKNKYHAKPTVIDGIRFASKKEAGRYSTLKMLYSRGVIKNLEIQPRFKIEINGVKVCDYVADFQYQYQGKYVVEDVKGFKKGVPYALFKIKKKLMKAVLGKEIDEI